MPAVTRSARPLLPAALSGVLLAVVALCAGCASLGLRKNQSIRTDPRPTLLPVRYVDLDRYMGRWYVIANIPYFLERGKVASSDTYTLRPDGRIDTIFTFRKDTTDAPEHTWHSRATVENLATRAEWSVHFFGLFSAGYVVIDLDPDYRWAVVGEPSRQRLWILARDRQLPDDLYSAIVARTAAQGYDPAKIVKVPQPAS